VHVIFATKHRQPWIGDELRERLHAYIGGTLKGLGATPVAIGGTQDHMHLLIGLKTTHSVSDLVRETKKASTSWVRVHQKLPPFAWQEGDAAFSVSADGLSSVSDYIQRQPEHHQKLSAIDELRRFLEANCIEVDERYFE
jgi:REP element-mobilizing transposase RayT